MLTFSGNCRSANRIRTGATRCGETVVVVTMVIATALAGTALAQSPKYLDAASSIAIAPQALIEFDAISGFGAGHPFVEFGGSTWIEHIAGDGPGWDPYTALGGSIPVPLTNGVLMIEGQGLLTNEGNGAGSVGLHRRFFVGRSLVGVGVWYDVTQSPNQHTFHQTSASFEWFPADHWTVRANGYLPVGTRTENITTVASTSGPVIGFQQNNLISSTLVATRIDDAAMRGYDLELARNIGTWAGEAFLAFYNYEGDVGGSTDGIKGGLRGYITPRLAGSVTVSQDPDFGTNVYGGITWHFGGRGAKAPRSICDKLTIPVERNPQIVINEARTALIDTEVLTDGGAPITVTHVRSPAGGANPGLGTWENPFNGLPVTQNTDIVYVHANSTFDGQGYVLNPDQSFLGEGDGNVHTIVTDQAPGFVTLPAGNGGGNRPVIQNTPLGVQVTDGSRVSNIRIVNAATGIFADNVVSTVDVDRTIIEGGATGIGIDSSTGQFTFTDVSITDPTVIGLFLAATSAPVNSADVTFGLNSTINQSTDGAAVLIADHDGTVNFAPGSTVSATNGIGLSFQNADGQYNFNGDVTLNGGLAGIGIVNNSNGTFTFGPNTSITKTAAGTAFVVNNLSSSAQIDFDGSITGENGGGDLIFINTTAAGSIINFNNAGANSISGDGAGGIAIFSADGNVAFTTPVSIQNPVNAGLLTGISILGGSGNIDFSDTSINLPSDGFNAGVEITNQLGSITFNNLDIQSNSSATVGLFTFASNDLTITGNNTINTTGGPAIHLNGLNTINMTFNNVTAMNSQDGIFPGNGVTLFSIGGGTFDVTGTTTVNGANGANGIGIHVDDSTGTFTFADVDINGTMQEGIAVGTLAGNPGMVTINGGTISNTGGNGVTAVNASGFNLNNTTFSNTTGFTIDLTGSTVSGMGNSTVPAASFSSNDGGGNAGMILFNGGADSAP